MAERNLARAAEETFARLGDYDSLWFDGRWIRSGELHDRAARLAAWLTAEGLRPGDRVIVLMANCPEVPVAYNAIWRAGGVVTPAIFLLPPAELEHMVADSGATVVLATPELAGNLPDGVPVVTTDELREAEPADVVPRAPNDPAALLYTGGTTGRSKGVLLSHENLWFAGKAGHEAGHLPEITRGLLALPLSHAFGLLVTVVGLHAEGQGQTVLMRWFDPTLWLELAQEHRTQITAVVPSMLQLLLAQPLEDYDLSELRYVVSGGAPLPIGVAEELLRRLPQVEIREGYGLTESSALVTSTPPGQSRLGSVGKPVPGIEVRIDGDDDVGEICVRSPAVMLGYWGQPDATADAIDDGWLRTGDLGYLDDDGYLYVVDRKKDLIIRGGFNVFPRDVEEAMLEHSAVVAAGVVGRPDEAHGEEVVAFVELGPRQDATPEDLVAFAKQRIGGYKYPREVHLVGSLPLTPVGKVDRKALRARLLEEATA
ncbi:MAG: class I adenylate-forming enzyme family protein [Gaiellaceae bacterium]